MPLARPRRQGRGLMRNTLLQAQCSHVNLITPFYESPLSVRIGGRFCFLVFFLN